MTMDQIFNKDAYKFCGVFNSGYMGAVLDMLKMSQHLYKKEDVVAIYRFLADVIEDESIPWSGTFGLKNLSKSTKIKASEPKEESIAPSGSDTTPNKSGRKTANPVTE